MVNKSDKPIKVLHIVGAMNRAGQETFLMNVFNKIDREKFHFSFLYNNHNLSCDYDQEIKSLGGSIVYPPIESKRFKLFSYLKENKDIDILYIPTNNAFSAVYSIILGKISGINHIVVHSHSSKSKHKILNYIFRPILRNLNVRKYACSELAGKWLFGKNIKDVQIVMNGISQGNYVVSPEKRQQIRNSLDIKNNQLALVHIGRFIEVKNHKFLLKVFKELKLLLPDAVLVLVGDGELKNEIINEVDRLNLKDSVIFTGIRSDIPDLLMGMDMFILPSLYEGLPVTAIEAQASGLKCMLSNTITQETKISDNVSFLPLEDGARLWAEQIVKESRYERKNSSNQIKASGYDICEIAKWMEKDYCSFLKK